MHGIWKHLKKPFYKAVLGTSRQISPAVRNFHVTLQINLLRECCLPPWWQNGVSKETALHHHFSFRFRQYLSLQSQAVRGKLNPCPCCLWEVSLHLVPCRLGFFEFPLVEETRIETRTLGSNGEQIQPTGCVSGRRGQLTSSPPAQSYAIPMSLLPGLPSLSVSALSSFHLLLCIAAIALPWKATDTFLLQFLLKTTLKTVLDTFEAISTEPRQGCLGGSHLFQVVLYPWVVPTSWLLSSCYCTSTH